MGDFLSWRCAMEENELLFESNKLSPEDMACRFEIFVIYFNLENLGSYSILYLNQINYHRRWSRSVRRVSEKKDELASSEIFIWIK